MKIIAHAGSRYLVEMSDDEIARAAGYRNTYDAVYHRHFPEAERGMIRVGREINVTAAYTLHSRIVEHEGEAKKAAGTLRALASILDGAMPIVAIPETTDVKSDEEATNV